MVVQARGDILQPENLLALDQLTQEIQAIPGVNRIDGLANVSPESPDSFDSMASRFASGNFTRLSVIAGLERNSEEAQDVVKAIRDIDPANGLEILVGGETAQLIDTKSSLFNSIPIALLFVFGVTFVVLFLMFGSVVLPLKAVAMNALSIAATFGVLVWIFQDGNLTGALSFEPSGFLISALPMLLFAVVFGLSMDYEVFLLSRVKEEYDRTGDNTQAVAKGLQNTGRIITSAALLFIVVTGAFATADIVIIKSLGVGMAVAIGPGRHHRASPAGARHHEAHGAVQLVGASSLEVALGALRYPGPRGATSSILRACRRRGWIRRSELGADGFPQGG